jgi:hypothetical protein
MRITITFDGIPEMLRYINLDKADELVNAAKVYSDIPGNDPAPDQFVNVPVDPNKGVQRTADIINAAEAKEEKKTKKQAEAPAPATEKIDESYRVKVRSVLSALNKKTGENTAKELIAEFNADKLTGVALDDLPALMAKAQEALNA